MWDLDTKAFAIRSASGFVRDVYLNIPADRVGQNCCKRGLGTEFPCELFFSVYCGKDFVSSASYPDQAGLTVFYLRSSNMLVRRRA
ncbi:hypothetical protein K1719_008802 [Acacia pycnantha]|nr:hypothetical protein K1719_008802 [Acacia pycnantha]